MDYQTGKQEKHLVTEVWSHSRTFTAVMCIQSVFQKIGCNILFKSTCDWNNMSTHVLEKIEKDQSVAPDMLVILQRFLPRLLLAWRDIGVQFSIHLSVRWSVSPSTFASPLTSTLMFKFISQELITKTRLFKFTENYTTENENFQINITDIFHISAQNIDCGYSLEPPR